MSEQIKDGGPVNSMSLRDWFAGMALQGVYANPNCNDLKADVCAQQAYEAADALIAEREKGGAK